MEDKQYLNEEGLTLYDELLKQFLDKRIEELINEDDSLEIIEFVPKNE